MILNQKTDENEGMPLLRKTFKQQRVIKKEAGKKLR
jgi:hypothetical protein